MWYKFFSLDDAGIGTCTQLKLLKRSVDLLEPAGWGNSINGERETRGGPWGRDPTLHSPESDSAHVDAWMGEEAGWATAAARHCGGSLVQGLTGGGFSMAGTGKTPNTLLEKPTKAPQKKKQFHVEIQLSLRGHCRHTSFIYSLPLPRALAYVAKAQAGRWVKGGK